MPTYEYVCKTCGDHLEAVQSFQDEALTTCPSCNGELKKVFGSVGIVFKGSGFYKNDSRNSTASVTPPGSTETKSETKSEGAAKSEGATPTPTSTPTESVAKPAAPVAPSSPSTTST
jgi:putative FmdB family regulatory protein